MARPLSFDSRAGRRGSGWRGALALAASGLSILACGRPASIEDVVVQWTITPPAPIVGQQTVGELTLLDAAHQPLPGATVAVEAYMQHPGMAPVIEAARDRGNGAYVAHLTFSMAGDWTLRLTGTLPDGRTFRHGLGDLSARAATR